MNPVIAIIAPFPLPYGGMAVQAERLYNNLTHSGVASFRLPSNPGFPSPLKFVEKIWGLRTVIRFVLFSFTLSRIRHASVVHLFGASYSYFFLVVAPVIVMGKLMNRKVILNYRGGEAGSFFRRWKLLAAPLLRRADVIAVPSGFLKTIMEEIVDDDVVIIPNIMDDGIFSFRERSTLKPVLLVSRQLEPRYNVECAIRAFRIVRETYPRAVLKIAGGGSEEKRLRMLAADEEMEGIEFLGELSQENLARVYDESDIMINSSRVDNFPGVILEAFTCGLPVVTTNVGGIPYLVKDRETGLLVDDDDHEALGRKVTELLSDPDLALRISRNGKSFADRHSWRNVERILLNIYGINSRGSDGLL